MESTVWVFAIIFFGVFTQSVAGFGLSLVATPLLLFWLDIKVVSPLIALVGILIKLLLLLKYHSHLEFRALWKLTLASVLMVPTGVYLLEVVDSEVAVRVLGGVVLFYVVYSFYNIIPPALKHNGWAFFFGGLAGILGGAFNASGPPVVVYASSQRWEPAAFKGNLQAYALINGVTIAITHFISGNLTDEVWTNFWAAVPAIILAAVLGVRLDGYFNPDRFRRLVLVVLLATGLRMVF